MWWIAVATSIVYAALAEYVLHRFILHRRFRPFTRWFAEHTIEHHGHSRNDLNIGVHPITSTVIGCPLFAGCFWNGPWWALCVVGLACGYSLIWWILHMAHHDLGCGWIKTLPGYARLRRHHLRHHERPRANFGAIFIFTDTVFGTCL